MKTPHLLIVEARFYEGLSDALLDGAQHALESADASYEIVTVPGTLEIAPVIAYAAELRRGFFDGYVALGCVIRGETYHFEIVANESGRAITDLGIGSKLAIGNGIMTTENEEQAWVRCRRSELDKGGFAARAALSLIEIRRQLGTGQ